MNEGAAAQSPPLVEDDAGELEVSLYETRKQIHPRAVKGWFALSRIALVILTQAVFYGTAWLQWNGRQAVLFDLAARKFYLFGLVLWPQDIVYLTALLVIAALSLFLFTALGGRLFCGYACPQTVYTEIFMWIERHLEGDRQARIRLDAAPWGVQKLLRRGSKHLIWMGLALWTGATFVGYFLPIRELLPQIAHGGISGWPEFWILFYSFATYGNAGVMREQVCKYMCPYARFQSAMFDRDTLIITYDRLRGEPRGSRSRKADRQALGVGDCIDCGICVEVCPTGIDIRNGLQYECIGCAACVDGCNQIMKKMNYPTGLIRYSTQNALREGWSRDRIVRRMLRPRTLIYSGILIALITGVLVSLALRVPLRVDVLRDRIALARILDDGTVENVYRLQIMNSAEVGAHYRISVQGIAGITMSGTELVDVNPSSMKTLVVALRAPSGSSTGSHPIRFIVQSEDARRIKVSEKSVFRVPTAMP